MRSWSALIPLDIPQTTREREMFRLMLVSTMHNTLGDACPLEGDIAMGLTWETYRRGPLLWNVWPRVAADLTIMDITKTQPMRFLRSSLIDLKGLGGNAGLLLSLEQS